MPISNRVTLMSRTAWRRMCGFALKPAWPGYRLRTPPATARSLCMYWGWRSNGSRQARAAIDASCADVLLTARAECFLVGHAEPLREAIKRLQTYAEAGADVLYAPGPQRREEIETIVAAVSPKPVNVLMSANTGLTVADVAAMGVRRVSVGSSLARAAWTGFIHAAKLIAEEGSFAGFEGLTPYAELNKFFREDRTEKG